MKVLVAEDDAVSRCALGALLRKWGYEALLAKDGQECWEILQSREPPLLAILDWMMPGKDGTQVCRELRETTHKPYTYVILLTARGRKEDVLEGMEAGADDYVCKPFDSLELKARLRAGSRIIELQRQLIAAQESVQFQAMHDSLTGLWNHGAILDILRREIERAVRERHSLGVIMADLDHFKEINDRYGHQAGDAVLFDTARRLLSCVRPYDSIGRCGGEEFLAVIPGADQRIALRQAERLRQAVCQSDIQTLAGPIHVSMSLGVTSCNSRVEPDEVLRSADSALYRAKAAGRNCAEWAQG